MPQVITGVHAGSEDYSHEIVLSHGGQKLGFHLPSGVEDIRPIPPQRQPPAFPLSQNSHHGGRGFEVWIPNQFGFYDSKDMWTTTRNKLHPQLLTRFAEGFRNAEMNFPDEGDTFVWKPLYNDPNAGNYRFLAVSFTASASSNRERCFLIVRRKVPAGATGAPGALTVEWTSNSGGDPSTVRKTITKSASDAPDVVSYVMEFKPSSVLAVTASTVYHIKIYGASSDVQNSCWEVLCSASDAGKASTNDSSWSSVDWSPFYRITDADVNKRIFFFSFHGLEYAVDRKASGSASQMWIHGTRGKATAGSTSSLTDTGAGQYGGTFPNMTDWKIRLVKGTGAGQVRTIASNTATVITPSVNFDIAPDNTTEYICYHPKARWKEITGHGLGVVTSKPMYANGTIYFPQSDSTNIRIMQLNYSNANDHGFDVENTNNNKASILDSYSIDPQRGSQMWRANNASAIGTPTGKAVSVAQGDLAPAGTPLTFGTDITFQTSILLGDNTNLITGLYSYENQIYVAKEDLLYIINARQPTAIKYGADASPSVLNGVAACTGMDGLFYIAANHDVINISGRSAIPLRLNNNLPATRSGYVMDLTSILGWLFAAVDAVDGDSSVMKYSFETKSWSEQLRAPVTGRRIRSVAFETGQDVRPTMLVECGGDVLYQEFPLFGTRPIQDTGALYTWEGIIELPTVDLLNTNPKYFSLLEANIKGLAGESASAYYGREVMFEYQLDNKIGTSEWVHGGAMTLSPLSKIKLQKGSRHKIRIRLRILNNDPSDPPIIENVTLTLFERYRFTREWMVNLRLEEDEDVSGLDMYEWLVNMTAKAEPVYVQSIFKPLDKKNCALTIEPNFTLESLSESGIEATAQIILSEVVE